MATPAGILNSPIHLQTLLAGGMCPGRLQRQFIRASVDVESISLRFPPLFAPLVTINPKNGERIFELPLAVVDSDDQVSATETEIDITFNDGSITTQVVDLITAPRRIIFEGLQDTSSEVTTSKGIDNASLAASSMIDAHLESINEIHFPDRDSDRARPPQAEGMSIISWSQCRSIFSEHSDDDEAKMRLIVRIATECEQLVEDLCTRPHRILRRIRRLERVERAQQLDSACIRWLIRQPGRTLVEKAGPKRQVMSIIRTDSADTPENRVLRDFLERCQRAASQYLKEHEYLKRLKRRSNRVDLVHRFLLKATRLLSTTEIGDIPRLAGLAQPNYVLQFDERYSRLWPWYERLRRHQTELDNVWRWQHRLWAERCILTIFAALDEIQGKESRINTRAFVRIEQDNGQFIDGRSPIGMWIDPRSPQRDGILAIRGESLPNIVPVIDDVPVHALMSDLFIAKVDRFQRKPIRQLMAISCCFDSEAWSHTEELKSAIGHSDSTVGAESSSFQMHRCIMIPAPADSKYKIVFCDDKKRTALVTLPIDFESSIAGVTEILKHWMGGHY
ncbi:MAG: DUF2357 domain-containing protein [Planctomycetes bacterium]|nr:DUF2357 domain-containing protein [Planctomycetota bacterium]